MTALDPEYLEILRCPVSLKPLVQQGEWLVSTDAETRLRYPIRDGFPVMLKEESEELTAAAWQESMNESASSTQVEAKDG